MTKRIVVAALGDPRAAVQDEVLTQSPPVDMIGLEGHGDSRIATEVVELALVVERPEHHLAILDTDPRDARVRRAVGIQRHDGGNRRRVEQGNGRVGQLVEHVRTIQ